MFSLHHVHLMASDIEATPPEDIDRYPVAVTVCGGRITHRA